MTLFPLWGWGGEGSEDEHTQSHPDVGDGEQTLDQGGREAGAGPPDREDRDAES